MSTAPRYIINAVTHRPGVGGYVIYDTEQHAEVFAGTFAEAAARGVELNIAEDRARSLWHVAYAVPGYSPNLDEDSEPTALRDLDAYLQDELTRAADHAEDSARAYAEQHDYQTAWQEHERAEGLANLAQNVSPARRNAPLYAGNETAWLETLERVVRTTFPVYVSEHEALYVWQVETETETETETERNCQQCGKSMNPAEWLLGSVCGTCCRANHRAAVQGR